MPNPSLSSQQTQFMRLAQYNAWFNKQLYTSAEGLDEVERKRDRGAFFRSIHDTLDHILLVDRIWLSRVERSVLEFPSLSHADLIPDFESLDQGVSQDFSRLSIERQATDTVLEAFAAELSQDHLDQTIEYQNSKGIPFATPLWFVVTHLFNHQTHHRGQVTTLLSQAGIDPGVTDFMVVSIMPMPE